jgi:hypothetical protein
MYAAFITMLRSINWGRYDRMRIWEQEIDAIYCEDHTFGWSLVRIMIDISYFTML